MAIDDADPGDVLRLFEDFVVDASIRLWIELTIDLNGNSLGARYIWVRNAEVVIENGTLVPTDDLDRWYDDGVATGIKYFVRTDKNPDGGVTSLVLDGVTIEAVVDPSYADQDITMVLIGNAGRGDLEGDGGIIATDSLTVTNCDLTITKQTNYSAYAIYTFAEVNAITGTNFNESFRAFSIDGGFVGVDPVATLANNDFSGVTEDTYFHVGAIAYDEGKGSPTVNEVLVSNADGGNEAAVEATVLALANALEDAGNVFADGSRVLTGVYVDAEEEVKYKVTEYDGADWGTPYPPW